MIARNLASAAAALALIILAQSPCGAQERQKETTAPVPAAIGEKRAPSTDNAAGTPLWTMDDVVGIALSRHPLVGQADAETTAAAARKGQAQAAYYPSIGLSTGYSRSRAFSASTKMSATTVSESAQGTLSQLITDFGRTGAAVDRADALLAAARETGKSTRQDVAFAAKIAYFTVLREQRILTSRKETVRQRESLLKQARAYYDAGIRARIDVARAEANLFQARAELTTSESNLRVARVTLLNRMGVDGPADFTLEDTLAAGSVPGDLPDWIAEAEKNRPELKSFLSRELAAENALRAARAGYYPVIAGTGGYGYAAEEAPLDQNYLLSVQLSVPVFSGFLTRRQVAEAEANLSSARFAVTDLRRQVRLQVEQAALAVQASSEQTDARRKERDASEENLRLATGRYEVGAGDIIEMIDAQVQMTSADTSWIGALYDSSISAATLLRALGR